jgi:hypothetical protein
MKQVEHQQAEHCLSIMPEHHAWNIAEQCPTYGRTHLRENYSPFREILTLGDARRGAERFALKGFRSACAARGLEAVHA